MNKKLPAFTIMEVTIAMLVAGIAIAITFTAYRIVSGAYLNFGRKQEKVAAVTLLDKLLKTDVRQASRVLKTEDGLSLQLEQGLIRYSFTDTTVLRNQFTLRTDTFKLVVKDLGFSFEQHSAEEEGLVDQLGFKVVLAGDVVPLQYQKLYSATDLFE